jgi:hypothetical protein
MAKTIVGIFKNRTNAETAIDELQTLGYDTKNLSVIMKDYRKKDGMDTKGANVVGGAAAGAAATVTGAATGALAGGLLGSLIGLGIPEKQAKVYEEYIRAGGILLVVPTRNIREEEAENILRGHNALDIKVLELPREAGVDERIDEDPDRSPYNRRRTQHYATGHHG